MITAITVGPPREKTQVFENPTREDLERILSLILENWTGQFEIKSDDDWSLTMFGEPGKYHIGIVRFDDLCFFAKNPNLSEPDETRIHVAWNDAPRDEVITRGDVVKQILRAFYETARPTPELQWRKIEVE